MKKILFLILLSICFLFCSCNMNFNSHFDEDNLNSNDYDNQDANDNADYDEETLIFGNYRGEDIEWIVLDEDDDKKLLLSKYVLDAGKYCDQYGVTGWDDSDLNDWLNDDFLYSAFDEDEIEQITYGTIEVEYYDNEEVFENDEDVFILSDGEINHYSNLLGHKLQECYPTSYVSSNFDSILAQSDDGNSEHEGEVICWVRSEYSYGTYMYPTSDVGWAIAEYNDDIAGIRPAIWINN